MTYEELMEQWRERNPRSMIASDVDLPTYLVFFDRGCNWCGAALTGRAKRWCPRPRNDDLNYHWPSACMLAYAGYWYARPAFQRAVLIRDHFTCQACGAKPAIITPYPRPIERPNLGALHIDHVVPFSRGGATTIDNLQVLCVSCNLTKGNQPDRLEAKLAQQRLGSM